MFIFPNMCVCVCVCIHTPLSLLCEKKGGKVKRFFPCEKKNVKNSGRGGLENFLGECVCNLCTGERVDFGGEIRNNYILSKVGSIYFVQG